LNLPDGFTWIRVDSKRGFARPGAEEWVRDALRGHVSIWKAAEHVGPLGTFKGRAPLLIVPGPQGRPVVIRRYWRGGGMRFLEDRHLRVGTPRPVREAQASRLLIERGIPTPPIVAAGIYPAGAFYRADLVTELVPDAVDLGALLFNPPEPWRSDPELRIRALARSGSLIKRMASAGVKHPDLNARNLLLHRTDDGVQPVLIDLDRCAVSERPAAAPSLLRRLERSARKIGHTVGGYWPAESWSILVRAATGGEEP
jgi:tRNA A-37 threonylcarbamoyl transferase component Bud32